MSPGLSYAVTPLVGRKKHGRLLQTVLLGTGFSPLSPSPMNHTTVLKHWSLHLHVGPSLLYHGYLINVILFHV